MVTVLMMSAKMITLGLLKIKVFWNKGYHIIISLHNVTNKILSRDSNSIAGVVMWPKFGNSSISMTSYHNLNFLGIWKKHFFLRGGTITITGATNDVAASEADKKIKRQYLEIMHHLLTAQAK